MSLHIIDGPMFSGKTTKLLNEIKRYKISEKKTILIRYQFDNRYSSHDCIVSHDGISDDAIVTDNILAVKDKIIKYDVIGIDEAQFFENIVVFIRDMLMQHNKRILVAMLNGDFKQEIFKNTIGIYALATIHTFLYSVCNYCKSHVAVFSVLKNNHEKCDNVYNIGGCEKYMTLCLHCLKIFNIHKYDENQ